MFIKKQVKHATSVADATSKALSPQASGGVAVCKPGGEKEARGTNGPARGNLAPPMIRKRG